MRSIVVAVALAGMLVGCGNRGGVSGQRDQGIRGAVVAGPRCPVETAESPCPPAPLPGIHVDVRRGGEVVADAVTDRHGNFSVGVDPGTYEVQATPGQTGFMSSKPVTVVVRQGRFTDVTVPVDTGIR